MSNEYDLTDGDNISFVPTGRTVCTEIDDESIDVSSVTYGGPFGGRLPSEPISFTISFEASQEFIDLLEHIGGGDDE